MASRGGRSPAGYRVLEQVVRRLAEGSWPEGVTVLTGDDLYHLDRAQASLIGSLVAGCPVEFALTVFGVDPVEVSQLVAAARSRAMFAPRRVVVLRDVAALVGEAEPLELYAANPPPQSYLIVRAPELDLRRKLHKALLAGRAVLTFSAPVPSDTGALLGLVQVLAAERALELERAAAAFIGEVCGADAYRISNELDKLACWLGTDRGGRVTLDAAREVVAGSGAMSGWEVADAVLARDGAGAAAAARRLLDAGDEPLRMLGGVAWRARSMLQAKAMLVRGARRADVVGAVRAWGYADALFEGLGRYRLDELLKFPAGLLRADRTLKSRSIDPRALVQSLVEELAAPVASTDGSGP
jgi:DNA polymerase-3 subunit delta